MRVRPDRDGDDGIGAEDEKTNEPERLAQPAGLDPWHALAALTPARIARGRVGHAQRTETELALRAAAVAAREAVRASWDPSVLAAELDPLGLRVMRLATRAADRETYLRDLDAGRQLTDASRAALRAEAATCDVAIVVTDGLSAGAVRVHGASLVKALVHALRAERRTLAPIVLLPNARVAASDMVGEALGVKIVLCVAGEAPGLSAIESLALHLTYGRRGMRADLERNTLSNIRPPVGIDYLHAGHTAAWLVGEALRLGLSGLGLKDANPSGPPSSHGLVRPA